MPYFDNNGVKIYHEIDGNGPDLVMLHGFAANLESRWKRSGLVDALKAENRLIMMDCRGHGKSDKPTDPTMYGANMVSDITGLMDYLGIRSANFIGYSMGSRFTLELLLTQPERFRSAILGGFTLRDPMVPGSEEEANEAKQRNIRVEAYLAESPDQVTHPVGKLWRTFAESTGSDPKALAAVTIGWSENRLSTDFLDRETLLEKVKAISVPVMTVVGSEDFIPGDKSRMATIVPNSCHFLIQGRGHVPTAENPVAAVEDSKFHMVVRAFLNYVNGQ